MEFFGFEILNSGIFLGRKCGDNFFVYFWGFFGSLKQSEDSW